MKFGLSGDNPRELMIVKSGLELSLRSGFRNTSMEAVAKHAGVAKPTLYKYFPDKAAVFRGVVDYLLGQAQEVCLNQFSKEGSGVMRIAGVLAEKNKMFFRLLNSSPHAQEMFLQKNELAGPQLAVFENWLEGQISSVLELEGAAQPLQTAQLMIACAHGIAIHAKYVEQIGPAVRLVVGKLLA